MSDSETALKERLKRINSILYSTSVDDTKSNLFHINDIELLRDCYIAECDSYNRTVMLKNIKIRINEISKSDKDAIFKTNQSDYDPVHQSNKISQKVV